MDLIDREQLMNYIRSRKINIGKLAHDVVMKQPNIQMQEPKTGHWIFKDEDDKACLIYTCDKCGEQISIFDDTIKSPQEGHYNFCPNCGAKMESEDKE